jgi:hypothetical protein
VVSTQSTTRYNIQVFFFFFFFFPGEFLEIFNYIRTRYLGHSSVLAMLDSEVSMIVMCPADALV